MRKWRSRTWLLFVVLALFLYGCAASTTEPALLPSPLPTIARLETVQSSPPPATSTPAPSYPTRTPIGASPQAAEELSRELPTFTPGPPGIPTETPTPTIQPGLRAETLPRPLYFIAQEEETLGVKRLWRLDPGASEVEPVTPADMDVSAAAIWPGDGRLVYGTRAGQLYAVFPGESPRLLVDMAPAEEAGLTFDNPFVSSLTWSPEGERLAYSVWSYSNIPSPEADGLWLLNLADGTQIKLLDSRYMDRETSDVSQVQIPRPLAWSPDGQALFGRVGYWEHSDMMWLEPLVSTADDSNLHDPEGLWVDASWSLDGRAVWLSGMDRGAAVSDLAQAGRDQAQVSLLLDGDNEGMAFYRAQELPAGLVFLVVEAMDHEARLYLGQETDTGFTYKAAMPANALCAGELVWDITWDPTGQWAAVSCKETVKLISLADGSEEDLSPFLRPLSWLTEQPLVFWGA